MSIALNLALLAGASEDAGRYRESCASFYLDARDAIHRARCEPARRAHHLALARRHRESARRHRRLMRAHRESAANITSSILRHLEDHT